MNMTAFRDESLLHQAVDWHASGKGVAIATVVETWGSSPRPVGSQLVVNEDSEFMGSVSGGCIEGTVVETALKVMQTGEPTELEFGVTDEMAWEVGLACGGTVRVFVERLEP
jgi:xanthine/CO dehydrogenase XdhC/CoxF family maturation factor